MAKTLTATLTTATAQTVTQPGYLVELAFAVPLRLSTRGDQAWNGLPWTGGRLGKVRATDGGGTVEIINTDLAAGALALNEGVADMPIRVWAFHTDNPDLADVVPVFDGVGDGVEIGDNIIRIKLAADGRRTSYSPRRFVNAAAGFNHLLPAGSRISWGGEVFVLERNN